MNCMAIRNDHNVIIECQGEGNVDTNKLEQNLKKNTRTENYTVTFINDSLVTGNGEGNGTPLQYSCLENPIDGEAWQAAVHGVARVRHN